MAGNLPPDLALPERIVSLNYALAADLRRTSDASGERGERTVQVLAVGWGEAARQGAIGAAPLPAYLVFDRFAPESLYWVRGDYLERLTPAIG